MKLTPEALAALGLSPDAAADEISAAIVKICGDKKTAEAGMATAESAVSAANSRATVLETELTQVRSSAADIVLGAALADGRITEAEKPRWTNALNTSFVGEAAKLAALMPVINTSSKLPGLGERKAETPLAEGIDAINTAVRATAAANSLDLTNRPDYDKAYDMTRAAKPELFKRG